MTACRVRIAALTSLLLAFGVWGCNPGAPVSEQPSATTEIEPSDVTPQAEPQNRPTDEGPVKNATVKWRGVDSGYEGATYK